MTRNVYGRYGPERQELATPRWFVQALRDRGFHLALDVCASPDTAVCGRYYTPTEDGLSQSWENAGWAFCNPPFSQAAKWLAKAASERYEGTRSLLLLPFLPVLEWFRDWFPHALRIELIVPRLCYMDSRTREETGFVAVDSCLWVFDPRRVHPSSQELTVSYWEARKPK